jgi:hypothetical protein
MLLTGGCTINESGPLTLPLIIINEILDVDMYVCIYIHMDLCMEKFLGWCEPSRRHSQMGTTTCK